MSAFVGSYRGETDASYAADFGRDREPIKKRSRFPEYRRSGGSPGRVSGMHCRRNKRWTWGSGRGARMQNLRAFAGCLAIALAGVASQAVASPLTFKEVGDPGNAAQSSGVNAGLGAVANTFYMSSTETTVAQYTSFLNQAAKADPNGLYDTNMSLIGITRSGSPGTYVYTSSTAFNLKPVTYVSWYDAARYVNWLMTGTTTEAGAYNLALSGSAAFQRQPGATYFLPSANEWYKAAFYRPTSTSYGTWASTAGSGTTTPSASVPVGSAPAANYNLVAASTSTDVGSYSTTVSSYGMYDMLGNVTEWTDTAGSSTQTRVFSGAYTIALANVANWGANGAAQLRLTTNANDTIGFRVGSTIAPVPEPGTIALAGSGLMGMVGAGWLKRRKRQAQLLAAAEAIAG
ncbi:MAG: SUMF1/EgtB/PvdO family nonheme iron enzyme [Planctomycetaceae bacterium]